MKQKPNTDYKPIEIPKNTPIGLFIAIISFVVGFAIVWHMYWLVPIGLVGIIGLIIARTFDEDSTRTISVAEIKKIEAARGQAAWVRL